MIYKRGYLKSSDPLAVSQIRIICLNVFDICDWHRFSMASLVFRPREIYWEINSFTKYHTHSLCRLYGLRLPGLSTEDNPNLFFLLFWPIWITYIKYVTVFCTRTHKSCCRIYGNIYARTRRSVCYLVCLLSHKVYPPTRLKNLHKLVETISLLPWKLSPRYSTHYIQ